MPKFTVKHPSVSHMGHNVSHAKNRTARAFHYNLQTVTVVNEAGKKQKMRVPAKILKQMKKAGITTHWKADSSPDSK